MFVVFEQASFFADDIVQKHALIIVEIDAEYHHVHMLFVNGRIRRAFA